MSEASKQLHLSSTYVLVARMTNLLWSANLVGSDVLEARRG